MAQSIDHPSLLYVEARKLPNANGVRAPMFTIGRPQGPPLWIVIHDMEGAETATIAENLATYQANGSQGRNVSSHYCADNNSVVQCVQLQDSAWTVGNKPGNNRGINWELAGRANQTRDQWLDDFGRAMFAVIAPIIRSDADRFGIPLRLCSLDDLRAFRPGITSHRDLGKVFGGTDHTDPGTGFPWDYLMALLTDGTVEEDMTVVAKYGEKDTERVGNRLQKRLLALDPNCLPQWGADGGYGNETVSALSVQLGVGDGKTYDTGDEADLRVALLERNGTGGGLTEAQVRDIAEQAADEAVDNAVVEVDIKPGT